MATMKDFIQSPEFQELDAEGQTEMLSTVLASRVKDFTGLDPDARREFVDDALRRYRPASTMESIVGALPVVGPLASQFVYGREAAPLSTSFSEPQITVQRGAEGGLELADVTGELTGPGAAVGRATMDALLLYGSMAATQVLGFTGKTIASIMGREAVEGGIYGAAQLGVTPPATPGEAVERFATEAVGGAVSGTVLHLAARGGSRLLNTQGSIRRSLEKEFGSPEIYSDFAKRTSQALQANDPSLVTEMEVDSALRAIEHRRGGAARDMREFLGEFKKAQAEQVLARQTPRMTPDELKVAMAEGQTDLINLMRDEEAIARRASVETEARLTETIEQYLSERKITPSNITRKVPQTEEEILSQYIANQTIPEHLRATRQVLTDEEVLSGYIGERTGAIEQGRLARLKAQFAEDAAVRQHSGLPVSASDDALKLVDVADYRVKAETALRQIEQDAIKQGLTPTQTFMRRLDAATTLAEGRGSEAAAQLRQIVDAGKDRIIASADNLSLSQAQAIAQDLRVAGLRSVQLSPEPGGKVFSVAATVGESPKEVQLRGAFDTYIKNKGIVNPINNTYAGLTVAEHRALGEAFGAPEAQIARFERLTTETLEQARKLDLRSPISAENLGVPLIEEQVVGSARSAATIRTDVGSLLPAPRPFLVGEPITAKLGDEEISGVVDAVALDASGRQAIVITTADGQTARIPDEAAIQHVFELTKPAMMPQPTGDTVLRIMSALDPSLPAVPPIRVRPGEISKAVDALRAAKVNASAKLRSNGDVDLDIAGVVKGRFNPREAEQIVENLLRSKMAQMEWQSRVGGKECL